MYNALFYSSAVYSSICTHFSFSILFVFCVLLLFCRLHKQGDKWASRLHRLSDFDLNIFLIAVKLQNIQYCVRKTWAKESVYSVCMWVLHTRSRTHAHTRTHTYTRAGIHMYICFVPLGGPFVTQVRQYLNLALLCEICKLPSNH